MKRELKAKSTEALNIEVVAITGAGGMGSACARRPGPGRTVVLGDFDIQSLAATERALSEEGCAVITQFLDTSDARSVEEFACLVDSLGQLPTFVPTAGVSPAMSSADRIYAANLLGTAFLLASFLSVARRWHSWCRHCQHKLAIVSAGPPRPSSCSRPVRRRKYSTWRAS